jgi:hypothetical protein
MQRLDQVVQQVIHRTTPAQILAQTDEGGSSELEAVAVDDGEPGSHSTGQAVKARSLNHPDNSRELSISALPPPNDFGARVAGANLIERGAIA